MDQMTTRELEEIPYEKKQPYALEMAAGKRRKMCAFCFWAYVNGSKEPGGCSLPDRTMMLECLSYGGRGIQTHLLGTVHGGSQCRTITTASQIHYLASWD